MKTVLLIDDELNSLEILEFELKKFTNEIHVIGKCSDSRKAKSQIEALNPDIVFLDIEMPWVSGFELLDSLEEINFHLIFVTAYDHFAVKAFEYFTIDYLLKPVSKNALERALLKISKTENTSPNNDFTKLIDVIKQQQKEVKKIALPIKNGYQFYNHSDIIRCEADSNYTKVFILNEKPILVSKSLKVVSDMLYGSNFFRPHQSHLINIIHMKKFEKSDGGVILMIDNEAIPISRHKKVAFLELVKNM